MKKNILYSFILNFSLLLVQIIGFLISGSLAILSEAVHNLSDVVGLLVSYSVERKYSKGSNKRMSYGYNRLRVLGGVFNIIIIIFGAFYIGYNAFQRLGSELEIDPLVMLSVGAVGVLVNFSSAYILDKDHSMNSRGAYLHLLLDAVGSVLVMVSAILIYFTSAYILDLIVSILIIFIILYSVKDVLLESMKIIIHYSPVDIEKVEESILEMEQVSNIHHTHIWMLDSKNIIFSTHVVSEDQSVVKDIEKLLEEEYNIEYSTIQVEEEHCGIENH